ncbi:MAG: LptA/OstA family protein [Oligosphaeraceae bacterium]
MTTVTRRNLLLAAATAALLAAPRPHALAQDTPPAAAAAANASATTDANAEEDELNVTAGRMEVLLDGKTIELTDNVRFEDSTMILTASRMMIFLDDTPQQADKDDKDKDKDKPREKAEGDASQDMRLKRVEAYTNVILRKRLDPTESVMGDNAVYDAHRDIVTLTGNCVVTQQGRTLRGKEVVFDRANSKINVQDVIFNLRLPKGGRRSLNGLFGDDRDKGKDKPADQEGKATDNAPDKGEAKPQP